MIRPVLPNALARRVFLGRHGLLAEAGGPGRGDDLAGLVAALGFVQLDSVNTLARAHDLILWGRRSRYRPPALDALLARRRLFEHWTHDAAAIPMAFYPHWRHRFARDRARLPDRWQRWHRHDFLAETDRVLRQIADSGPCSSSEAGPEGAAGQGGWWAWHPSKTALEFLWRTGELAVSHRDSFRKVYDLAERVIPEAERAARPSLEDSLDWAMWGALDRLGFATGPELHAFFALARPEEAKDWVAAALASGAVEPIGVEGADGRVRPAIARPGLFEAAAALPAPPSRVRVLSPFDPMLRDRARAERLFGFAYRIEIYVPEPRRRYGYYVFPVWQGDRAIGRIDMRREASRLAVRAFWAEPGVAMGRGRLARLGAELKRVARFVGATDIDLGEGWLRQGDGRID